MKNRITAERYAVSLVTVAVFIVMLLMLLAAGGTTAEAKAKKGTKSRPYIITLNQSKLKKNFCSEVQKALNKSKKDTYHYYNIVIPRGSYQCKGTLKLYSRTTLSAYGAKIYATNGANLIVAGDPKGKHVSGYNGYKNIKVCGGTWDGNSVALKKRNKFTAHCMVRMAHCTNLVFYGATFTHSNGNHSMEIAACKNVDIVSCVFTKARLFKGKRHAEALQIDVCNKDFGFYNGNGIKYGCENVNVTRCVFTGVSEGVGSHSYSKKHPYKNIRIHNNTFKNFNSYKRKGLTGYPAVHACYWKKSKIYSNKMVKPYIGVLITDTNSSLAVSKNTINKPIYAGVSAVANTGKTSIVKNNINSSKKYGMVFSFAKANSVTSNKIKSTKGYGIFLEGKKTYVKRITSNKVTNAKYSAVKIEEHATVGKITLNKFKNLKTVGIGLNSNAKVALISSNRIIRSRQSGISVLGKSKVTKIRNNALSHCGNSNCVRVKKSCKGIAINAAKLSLRKGVKKKLSISKGEGSVTYHTSNSRVCSVSGKGKIKANQKGRAQITVSQKGCSSSVIVKVK